MAASTTQRTYFLGSCCHSLKALDFVLRPLGPPLPLGQVRPGTIKVFPQEDLTHLACLSILLELQAELSIFFVLGRQLLSEATDLVSE